MDMIGAASSFLADAKFASLKNVGDELVGTIVDGREVQATYKGQLQFWPLKPGQTQPDPKIELRLTFLKDDGSEEILTVPRDKRPGSRQAALKEAVRAAGLSGIPMNARGKIAIVSKDDDGRAIYKFALKAPEVSVD